MFKPIVAEYSTQSAETPQVSYLTSDHLGSPRVITNQPGAVTTRKDYMAFGEETYTAQRTSAINYDNQSETRKGYTGYQKDDESGLDFAQARYYNSKHGRFTSVDPLMASANVKNPQTFNRYSYVLNSPYKFTDPLGLISSSTGACGTWCRNSDGGMGGGAFNSAVTGGFSLFCWCVNADYLLNQPDGSKVVNNIVFSAAQIVALGAKTINDFFLKVNVVLNKTTYKYVPVSGDQAADAAVNSGEAITAAEAKDNPNPNGEENCKGNGGGCTSVSISLKITQKLLTITLSPTIYLPQWTGYNSADSFSQGLWDDFVASSKLHEEFHITIYKTSFEVFLRNKIPATVKNGQLSKNSIYLSVLEKIGTIQVAYDDFSSVMQLVNGGMQFPRRGQNK